MADNTVENQEDIEGRAALAAELLEDQPNPSAEPEGAEQVTDGAESSNPAEPAEEAQQPESPNPEDELARARAKEVQQFQQNNRTLERTLAEIRGLLSTAKESGLTPAQSDQLERAQKRAQKVRLQLARLEKPGDGYDPFDVNQAGQLIEHANKVAETVEAQDERLQEALEKIERLESEVGIERQRRTFVREWETSHPQLKGRFDAIFDAAFEEVQKRYPTLSGEALQYVVVNEFHHQTERELAKLKAAAKPKTPATLSPKPPTKTAGTGLTKPGATAKTVPQDISDDDLIRGVAAEVLG